MSYKTILVHADGSPQAAQRVRLAARLALAHDAHLIGAAMTGLSRHCLPDGSIAPLGAPFPFDLRLLRTRADAALTQFADCASRMGLHSFETRLVEDAADGARAGCCAKAQLPANRHQPARFNTCRMPRF